MIDGGRLTVIESLEQTIEALTHELRSPETLPGTQLALLHERGVQLSKKAAAMKTAGDREHAEQCLSQSIRDFTSIIAEDYATAEQRVRAHLTRGKMYGQRGLAMLEQQAREQGAGFFQKAIDDFSWVVESAEATVDQRAEAWFTRGRTRIHTGQPVSALSDFTSVIELGESVSSRFQVLLLLARLSRAVLYHRFGRNAEAVRDYSAIIEGYSTGNRDNMGVSAEKAVVRVGKALLSRGVVQWEMGLRDELAGKSPSATEAYRAAAASFKRAHELIDGPEELTARGWLLEGIFALFQGQRSDGERREAFLANGLSALEAVEISKDISGPIKACGRFYRGIHAVLNGVYDQGWELFEQVMADEQAPETLKSAAFLEAGTLAGGALGTSVAEANRLVGHLAMEPGQSPPSFAWIHRCGLELLEAGVESSLLGNALAAMCHLHRCVQQGLLTAEEEETRIEKAVSELRREPARETPPPRYYCYRNAERLLALLPPVGQAGTSGASRFHMENLAETDDPCEAMALLQYCRRRSDNGDQAEGDRLLRWFFNDDRVDEWLASRMYAIRFVEDGDRLDHWRMLGDNGRGGSLGIPAELFSIDRWLGPYLIGAELAISWKGVGSRQDGGDGEGGRMGSPLPRPYRVMYSGAAKQCAITAIEAALSRCHAVLEQLGDGPGSKAFRRAIQGGLLEMLYCFRSEDHRTTSEHRVLMFLPDLRAIPVDERAHGNSVWSELLPVKEVALFNSQGYELTIGPKVEHPHRAKRELEYRLEQAGKRANVTVTHSQVTDP